MKMLQRILLSNFEFMGGKRNYATVDVTTWNVLKPWEKLTESRRICSGRPEYSERSDGWFFTDDGEDCPKEQVEKLYRAAAARQNLVDEVDKRMSQNDAKQRQVLSPSLSGVALSGTLQEAQRLYLDQMKGGGSILGTNIVTSIANPAANVYRSSI